MKKDVFRAKIEVDEDLGSLLEDPIESSTDFSLHLKSEIKALKDRLKKLEDAYEVYHTLAKKGFDNPEDLARGAYQAAANANAWGKKTLANKLLLDACKNGYAPARIALAKAYLNGGFGVKKNPGEALSILLEVASTGDPEAAFLICELRKKRPELVSADLALDYCKKAADLGYEPAIERLQKPFERTEETKRLLERFESGEKFVAFWLSTREDLSDQERSSYFDYALKEEDPMAEYEMGTTLLRQGDREGAKEYYVKSTEHGNGPACFELARLILDGKPHYYKGPEIPSREDPDYIEELRLVRRAAELGDSRGLSILGRSYVRGYMVDQDYEAAKPLLEKALSQGEEQYAPQMLGEIYEHTEGPGNAEKAVEYYTISADHGLRASINALKRIYGNGLREVPPNEGKATYYGYLLGENRW